VSIAAKMNRLARLAALARVAGQNLPAAVTSESQVRSMRGKCVGGCHSIANLCSVGLWQQLSAVCSENQ
jgi:hypothetical protein